MEMKSASFLHVVYCVVLLHAAFLVLSEGILQEKEKHSCRIYQVEKKHGNFKGKGVQVNGKVSGKSISGGSVSRPECTTAFSVDQVRPKIRCGCHYCHHFQPCVGGCMPPCCDCHKEPHCDEGCWCPIPGKEEKPEEKPQAEPCCCPMGCPCCHHVHHHHYHCCCPCCHCCHCCCPCCCHCCHYKRSPCLLSSILSAGTFHPSLSPIEAVFHSPFSCSFQECLPLFHGPLRVY
ncbi:uncharacterized protein [Montipora capricornis]|uniref:uncharacterized protein n=1 Tax=Montipora capricornis TaxID=246305 RepID=UPI0035F1B650